MELMMPCVSVIWNILKQMEICNIKGDGTYAALCQCDMEHFQTNGNNIKGGGDGTYAALCQCDMNHFETNGNNPVVEGYGTYDIDDIWIMDPVLVGYGTY